MSLATGVVLLVAFAGACVVADLIVRAVGTWRLRKLEAWLREHRHPWMCVTCIVHRHRIAIGDGSPMDPPPKHDDCPERDDAC